SIAFVHLPQFENEFLRRHDGELRGPRRRIRFRRHQCQLTHPLGRRYFDPPYFSHVNELVVTVHVCFRPDLALIPKNILSGDDSTAASDNKMLLMINPVINGHGATPPKWLPQRARRSLPHTEHPA